MIYRCIPFPHSHLLCGEYIDASTMVYVDYSIFNYTEANIAVAEFNNNGLLNRPKTIKSCPWIVLYSICLSIYPHCNNTTQALIPPCKDDCLKYTTMCKDNTDLFEAAIMTGRGLLKEKYQLNCSVPFRAFDSVNVDDCSDFNCKLVSM